MPSSDPEAASESLSHPLSLPSNTNLHYAIADLNGVKYHLAATRDSIEEQIRTLNAILADLLQYSSIGSTSTHPIPEAVRVAPRIITSILLSKGHFHALPNLSDAVGYGTSRPDTPASETSSVDIITEVSPQAMHMQRSRAKKTCYAVTVGRKVGIFGSAREAEEAVCGVPYSHRLGYKTLNEARNGFESALHLGEVFVYTGN